MNNVRITVLKCTYNADLTERYGLPAPQPCPFHRVGESYLSVEGNKPDGFCEEAWGCLSKYAFALAHGAPGFWLDWSRENHKVILSCHDGCRPVIFLLEAVVQ